MRKFLFLISTSVLIFSCKKEVLLTFNETSLEYNIPVTIEINIPKAKESHRIATRINTEIETHIANTLNYVENYNSHLKLDTAIDNFNSEYTSFKTNFEESTLVWEATFDGEVSYQSSKLISISITSYVNTGGAHGSLNITFLNFNSETGDLVSLDDIINDLDAFKNLAEMHFKQTFDLNKIGDLEDYFFGNTFQLPANIGYNEKGIILFYNAYEIASYDQKPKEFIIPFDEVQAYLNNRFF